MPANVLEIHPEALEEALAGYSWYLDRSEKAADGFFASLGRAFETVAEAPERWPLHVHGTRRFVLPTFPYSVIYKAAGHLLIVYAVAHGKRRPGYWKQRLAWRPPTG